MLSHSPKIVNKFMACGDKISCVFLVFRATIKTAMDNYTLIRQNRRTISMRLDKDGNISVFAPLRLATAQIDRFVSDHARWISRKRAEIAARGAVPAIRAREGETVPLLGRYYTVRHWGKRTVRIEGAEIFLPSAAPSDALIRFYRRHLKDAVLPLIARYAAAMGVAPQRISVGSARTRWGACSGKDALTFSFRLALCEPFAVEYVVVHELCHIRHKNHSAAFWDMVGQYFPAYKDAKKYLKQKSCLMEIL